MEDFVYKGRVIGCTYFDKDYNDWTYEHSASGNATGGCSSRKEATELMVEDHLVYLHELKERSREVGKEIDEWEDHLK